MLNNPLYLQRYPRSTNIILINSIDLDHVPEHFPLHPDQFGVHHEHPEQPLVPAEIRQVYKPIPWCTIEIFDIGYSRSQDASRCGKTFTSATAIFTSNYTGGA
jgi:hypothetical protein